jgi:hypothetical protein
MTVSASAQQPAVTIDGDDITITGCVARIGAPSGSIPDMLVWSQSDIMMAGAAAAGSSASVPIGTSGVAGRVFFWVDEDLSKHVGQRVEVKGDLEDIEKGKIEIEAKGEFTEIELELEGREETMRVPTAWLSPGTPRDAEIEIAARRVDVDDVRILGACVP